MRWERVLIHHSAGPDTDGLEVDNYRDYHVRVRGWRDLGYHVVVERIAGGYEVILGRPLNMTGAHCPGQNTRAIGVCFAGNFEAEPPPRAMLEAAAPVLAGLMDVAEIPTSEIRRHSDYWATACPGASFPMDLLRSLVDEHR